jgi:MoaA/NifB/PqqE/SkfB family radical SAM enzyme
MEGGRYLRVLRGAVRPRGFDSLFLFVTSRCNSRCRTCFYFDKLNRRDDLTDEQIERLAASAPPFRKLWISGGEPFLRDRLADLIALFVRHNGVTHVNLPTNGLLAHRIFAETDRLLALCPDLTIDLNFSLDGLAATHDALRGVPDNFVRTLDALAEAERRYRGLRRLRRNVLTVITRANYGEIVSLGGSLLASGAVDGQYFQVMRAQGPDPSLAALTRAEVADLHRRLMPIHRRYARRLMAHLPAGVRQFARLYYLGSLRFHFDLHEQCLEGPRPWPMPCTAGQTAIVIDHNGRFRACEMREPVGDLAAYDFDVARALASPAMREETGAIARAGCWCTHSCFIEDSGKFSPAVRYFHIPFAWLRQRLQRTAELESREVAPFQALEIK